MKHKNALFISIFSIFVTIFFLYLGTPSSVVEKYAASVLKKNVPDAILFADFADMRFPLGIRLKGPVLHLKNGKGTRIEADSVTVMRSLESVLGGKKKFDIRASACGGEIEGYLVLPKSTSADDSFSGDITLNNLAIGKCSFIQSYLDRGISGVISGELSCRGNAADLFQSNGRMKFIMKDGVIDIKKNLMGFNRMAYDRIEMTIVIEHRVLTVSSLDFSGPDLKGTFEGKIYMNNDLKESRLDLKGNINIAALNKKVRVILSGTAGNPTPRFI